MILTVWFDGSGVTVEGETGRPWPKVSRWSGTGLISTPISKPSIGISAFIHLVQEPVGLVRGSEPGIRSLPNRRS